MKVKDFMTKQTYDKYGDIDVYDDYDERCACAWCGNTLTKEGEKEFAKALNLNIEVYVQPFKEAVVECDDERDAEAIHKLMMSAAGYCSEVAYKRWFND